ncbi:acyltransferase family protein [Roseateles terrae]|nr:acyltransferase [Roseateles terrae]
MNRGQGLDALRAVMTMLVVLHHTAITYGAIGGWFYKEILPNGSLQSKLLIFFCTFNQAFFMGLFFLLAGYFTPRAIQRKGVRAYLRDRFIRLGLPLLCFGWVLGPITIAWAQTASGQPFLETLSLLISRGEFERGPLWFCQALLMFACAAAVVFKLGGLRAVPAPNNRHLLWAAVGTGAAAFVLRLVWPVGMSWWGLQLGYFAGYLTLFWGGYAAASTRWLERLDPAQVQLWRRVCRWTLPVLPVLAVVAPKLPAVQGPAEGGWHVLAAVYAFWEPFVAWGVILGLLWRFQHRMDLSHPIWRTMGQRAYTIFVLHAPVVVGVALAWRQVEAPALVKFAVTGGLSCWLSYLLAGVWLWVWRRVSAPGAGRQGGVARG